ncbi:MAG TPA: hypothetical protein VFL45_10270 [Gammaproteobacteria bacterium]|nr:hypothetical protein [Gammaproteobacteria bacterium]
MLTLFTALTALPLFALLLLTLLLLSLLLLTLLLLTLLLLTILLTAFRVRGHENLLVLTLQTADFPGITSLEKPAAPGFRPDCQRRHITELAMIGRPHPDTIARHV